MEREVLVTSFLVADRVRSATARDGKPQASPKTTLTLTDKIYSFATTL